MKINKIFSYRGFNAVYHCILYIIFYFLCKVIDKLKCYNDIWLIAERPGEARDNGYHLFKYIRMNYPEKKVFYIIDSKSSDRDKILQYGNIIKFSSLKHILFYFLSTNHISTHINGCYPNEKAYLYLNKYFKIKSKNIFLQHGITKDYLKQLTAENIDLDLFICGAFPEYNYIKDTYGYKDGVVKYTGLARFDNLKQNNLIKNQILLMPTFRMDFYVPPQDKINKLKENYFLNSDYYKRYQSLINNKDLQQILHYNNLELIFFPHFEAQRYLHLFSTDNDNVIIANKNDYDVQTLLLESKVLITDYSSVYFDFAYLKKPIIYYHFDYQSYRNMHYKEGYFCYEKHGFGPIVNKEEDLIIEINNLIERNCVINNYYLDRINEFFPINDQNNCKRIFNEIEVI